LVTRSDRAAERQQLEVDMAVALVLPALGVDPLLDVALAADRFHCAADELLGRQGGEEGDRVVVHLTPEVGIEVTEDADHLGLPCPQEIARQLIQPRGKRGGRRIHHSSSKAWAGRSAHDSGRSLAVGTSQASGSPPGGW